MLRKNVLRRQKDFDLVYKKGNSVPSKHVVVLYRKNRSEETRIAFVASKKVGGSVARNRARRLMKEALRLSGITLKPGYDYIFVARNGIDTAKCQEVGKSLVSAVRRIEVKKK